MTSAYNSVATMQSQANTVSVMKTMADKMQALLQANKMVDFLVDRVAHI